MKLVNLFKMYVPKVNRNTEMCLNNQNYCRAIYFHIQAKKNPSLNQKFKEGFFHFFLKYLLITLSISLFTYLSNSFSSIFMFKLFKALWVFTHLLNLSNVSLSFKTFANGDNLIIRCLLLYINFQKV